MTATNNKWIIQDDRLVIGNAATHIELSEKTVNKPARLRNKGGYFTFDPETKVFHLYGHTADEEPNTYILVSRAIRKGWCDSQYCLGIYNKFKFTYSKATHYEAHLRGYTTIT